ncbi:MAG: hypothetical protein FD161_1852 [Limisphaerales bacterium]|nr:MAG: hypothetical protein FD161_1852 [Limisphaerales bacterium]TXT49053.1 MAG: hypothetical protein FD140_3304 [Limisphaerales bacterium]
MGFYYCKSASTGPFLSNFAKSETGYRAEESTFGPKHFRNDPYSETASAF